MLETAFEAELDEHLGYEHSEWPGKLAADRGENERNGSRTKTVWTELGPVEIGNAIVPDCRFAAQPTLRPCGGRS
ncbi:MAG: hypothetical protein GX875_06445 [Propionibacterium sp.]|nr:hypothetical protein [Propionibacterium sp.]